MAEVRLGRDEVENSQLPPVCMRCGDAADTFVSRQFSWRPSGIWLLLFLGLLPYLLVAMILEKRRRVMVPLCAAHKDHWRVRLWWGWGLFLGSGVPALGALLLPSNNPLSGLLCFLTVLALLAWVIALIVMQETAIHATDINDLSMTLTHVSPRFIEALSERLASFRPQAPFGAEPLEVLPTAPRQGGVDQIQRAADLRAGPRFGDPDPRLARVIECLAQLDPRDRQVQDFQVRLSHWQNLDAAAQAQLLRDVEAAADQSTAAQALDRFLAGMAGYFKPEVDGCLGFITFMVVGAVGTALSASLLGDDYCPGSVASLAAAIVLAVLAHQTLKHLLHRRFFRNVFLPAALDRHIDLPAVLARLRYINAHPAAADSGRLRDLAAALPRLEEVLRADDVREIADRR